MRYQVLVRLKPGVLDVQGKAVESGLKDKHFDGIRNVRIGRVIELEVEGSACRRRVAKLTRSVGSCSLIQL